MMIVKPGGGRNIQPQSAHRVQKPSRIADAGERQHLLSQFRSRCHRHFLVLFIKESQHLRALLINIPWPHPLGQQTCRQIGQFLRHSSVPGVSMITSAWR